MSSHKTVRGGNWLGSLSHSMKKLFKRLHFSLSSYLSIPPSQQQYLHKLPMLISFPSCLLYPSRQLGGPWGHRPSMVLPLTRHICPLPSFFLQVDCHSLWLACSVGCSPAALNVPSFPSLTLSWTQGWKQGITTICYNVWLLHRNLWTRSNTTFLREWTDKLFKIFRSSGLYFQEAKKITNKSSSESLFLEIAPHGQVNLWDRAYFIHHPLGNSLGQQIKGPENPCGKHVWLIYPWNQCFPKIISP